MNEPASIRDTEECPDESGDAGGFVIFLAVLLLAVVVLTVGPKIFSPSRGHHRSFGKRKSDIMAITSALDNYAINNHGLYPEDLVALVTPDVNGYKYLKQESVPLDPWGRAYGYEAPSPGQPDPRVFTLGEDGAIGGSGDDADLDNWIMLGGEQR